MTWTNLRTLTIRRLLKSPALLSKKKGASLPSLARSFSSTGYSFTDREKEFHEKGWLDDDGLTRFKTLHENQVRSCAIFADNELYGTFNPRSGNFEFETYRKFGEQVNTARHVLRDLGIGPGDKVALISNNRWEWAAISCAAYSLSAGIVPMYEAQLSSDWSYIVNDSQAKVLFCATQTIFDAVSKDVKPIAPSLQSVLCLDATEGEPHAFSTAMANASEDAEGKLIVEPTIDDLASLIYTSGTTGKPKGVELTHNNIATNILGASRQLVENPHDLFSPEHRSLAFLPWAHSYGQTCELWSGMAHGSSAGLCRGVQHILDDLQMVQPSTLFAVPTLYKKVYDGVNNALETANPRRKYLMQRALDLGRQKADYRNGKGPDLGFFDSMVFGVLDRLVLSKIRDRFGGKLRHAFVAGAACPSEVIDFMDSLGILVMEGYGLTETSPIISLNSPEQRSIGSVGRAIGGVKVHIIDGDGKPLGPGQDGEICCTGPNIMKGYYNNPTATEEVISIGPDGQRMFHTGDMGQMSEDGFIRVTGRIKELYKLENGKYVCPTPIEEAIGMSRFITQVVLVGANRPHNVVLIVPEWNTIRTEFNISEDIDEEELKNDERVKELIGAEIEMSCFNFKKFEIPTKFAFAEPFTVANNMLTPKMSIRRHAVTANYADQIDELYEGAIENDVLREKAA